MTELTLSPAELEYLDRTKGGRRAVKAWPLDKIVFVAVLGAAYACAALAVALPIYVWLF
jgi:hypothetical protein